MYHEYNYYKFDYEEFDDIRDAIQKLISFYKKYEFVDNPQKMEEIFYQTLNLSKDDVINNGIAKKK